MPFYDKMVEREDRHAQSPPSIVSETLSSLCKMSSVAGLWKGHSSAQRLTEGSGMSYVMYAKDQTMPPASVVCGLSLNFRQFG